MKNEKHMFMLLKDIFMLKWTYPLTSSFHVLKMISTYHMKNGMILEMDYECH